MLFRSGGFLLGCSMLPCPLRLLTGRALDGLAWTALLLLRTAVGVRLALRSDCSLGRIAHLPGRRIPAWLVMGIGRLAAGGLLRAAGRCRARLAVTAAAASAVPVASGCACCRVAGFGSGTTWARASLSGLLPAESRLLALCPGGASGAWGLSGRALSAGCSGIASGRAELPELALFVCAALGGTLATAAFRLHGPGVSV